MTLKHDIKKDTEELIIKINSFGQWVPVTISYKKDNFILDTQTSENYHKPVLDFVANNFYTIINLDKTKLFKEIASGELYYGNSDNRITILVDGEVRDIHILITTEGKIKIRVDFHKFNIQDIIDKIKIIKSTFADKNYEEILINELKGV